MLTEILEKEILMVIKSTEILMEEQILREEILEETIKMQQN